MELFFYAVMLIGGNLITNYNIAVNKGVEQRFLRNLNFNHKAYFEYFKLHPEQMQDKYDYKQGYEKSLDNETILSKTLYFEFLDSSNK